MKKAGIITATRAEYGLLSPVIRELRRFENDAFQAQLIVTGTHLSRGYGYTVNEIREDRLRIDHEIPVSVSSETVADISANQADMLVKMTALFAGEGYDAVVILGDRYEMLAAAMAAVNTQTPVFHICGGDISEGAIDDCIRHCITKMSYLHFPTNEESRRRVIQLGEQPDRVFNFGSPGMDNVIEAADMSREEALGTIGLGACRYALCTYHPVTLGKNGVEPALSELMEAMRAFPEIEFIVTKSNADQGGARINAILEREEKTMPNLHVYASLGVRRYLSLMRYACFVLGNSSSGLMEAPAFHIPTVNIGDRQKGRLRTEGVIDCGEDAPSIIQAVRLALSDAFREKCGKAENPYGDGHAGERIAEKIYEAIHMDIDLKKPFYDMYDKQGSTVK